MYTYIYMKGGGEATGILITLIPRAIVTNVRSEYAPAKLQRGSMPSLPATKRDETKVNPRPSQIGERPNRERRSFRRALAPIPRSPKTERAS